MCLSNKLVSNASLDNSHLIQRKVVASSPILLTTSAQVCRVTESVSKPRDRLFPPFFVCEFVSLSVCLSAVVVVG
jgi:hypothetical protein